MDKDKANNIAQESSDITKLWVGSTRRLSSFSESPKLEVVSSSTVKSLGKTPPARHFYSKVRKYYSLNTLMIFNKKRRHYKVLKQ